MLKGDRNFQLASCLIIGGGISGLIIATILQRNGIKVTVLDKGRGIGGRLATRRISHSETVEGVFDYGAQYFSVSNPNFQVWVDEWLDRSIVKEWDFQDGKSRYCGVDGIRGIAKYLAQELNVRTATKVVKINRHNSQWLVETENKQRFSSDLLVITPPVPQSLALLDNSGIILPPEIRSHLATISYYPCLAVLALFKDPCSLPSPGGLRLEDESLVWLASNDRKGISPQGYAVTLHATPQFSETHWQADDAQILQKLLAAAANYLTSEILEYQVHRWRYSLPKTFYNQSYLALPELSLVMAGDAFVSAKVEGAVLSGIAAAEYLLEESSRS
ncbi:MAG: NAD(P)-binding protein [Hydrococcus sp. CRU_1_1]|nr:NAD(P)-binding protein [Hydrococcus sp. CRU_1_1]